MKVIKKCGFLAEYFKHGGADYEYGIRVKNSDFDIIQFGKSLGFCERNHEKDMIFNSNEYILKKIFSLKYFPLKIRFLYYLRNCGPLFFLFVFTPYIKAIIHDLLVLSGFLSTFLKEFLKK